MTASDMALLDSVHDVFNTAHDRLRAMGADPIARIDCYEIGETVEHDAEEYLRAALNQAQRTEYRRILADLVDTSQSMLTRASTLDALASVLNWMSALAIRARALTLERFAVLDMPGIGPARNPADA